MFDNLMKLVSEFSDDAIVKNPAVPNEKNNAAIESTTESIISTLKNQFSGAGGASALTSFFTGSNAGLQDMIKKNASANLTKKVGVKQAESDNIVEQILPNVMKKFISKTNDPGDSSFDLGDIMKFLK